MIYIFGLKQDIVVSFVDHLLTMQPERYQQRVGTVHLEDLDSLELDPNDFRCLSMTVKGDRTKVKAEDRFYVRPYAIQSARKRQIVDEKQYRLIVSLYQNLILSANTILGLTCLRCDSNENKLLHSLLFNSLTRVPALEFQTVQKDSTVSPQSAIKSPSGFRTQVTQWQSMREGLAAGEALPILVQDFVNGTPIRVTVVGWSKVIATEFPEQSGEADYRYAKGTPELSGHSLELSASMQAECIRIAQQYNLPLCAIDYMRSGDIYYFLEVNPEPGWSYVASEQGQLILDAILEFMESSKLGELFPEHSAVHKTRLKTVVTTRPSNPTTIRSLPSHLIPDDYIAVPNEEHPLWT